jgi:hypothetical protein
LVATEFEEGGAWLSDVENADEVAVGSERGEQMGIVG